MNSIMNEKKLFGTDGMRGKANLYPMTADMVLNIGKSLAYIIKEKNTKKIRCSIVIGKDTRLSGYMLESALEAGIVSMGVNVLLVGPMPTPAIAHLVKSLNADGGIVISASHNPAEDNGIKILNREGYKLNDTEEKEIEDLILQNKIQSMNVDGDKIGKAYRVQEAYGRYIEFAKASIKSISLEGIRIVLDCANGAGYSVAPKIFSELGADIIVIGAEPDGLNINKDVGATHIKKMMSEVLKHKADVGIALDGDADRVIMCDEKGNEVCGDSLIGLLSKNMKDAGVLRNNEVVITVMSNLGLKNYLDKNGIKYRETPVGDKYVIEEMRKDTLSLGGEQSGHIILGDYVTTGDGIITALKIMQILKESKLCMSELVKNIQKYPQVLINIRVTEKKELTGLKSYKVIKEVEKALENNGRVLVRYSGTENLCRVMIEASDLQIAQLNANKIADSIKTEIGA